MRYLKMLGLASVAAAALTACLGAGAASATVLCSTTTTPCTSKWPVNTNFDFSLKTGTSSTMTTTGGETYITCSAVTTKGKFEKAGSATETVTGSISSLNWGPTCSFPMTNIQNGKLELHGISGTDNATVTGDAEAVFTIQSIFFGSCSWFWGSGAHLGTLVGGKPATLAINTVLKKHVGSEAVCPDTLRWTAELVLTEPAATALYVEPS